MIRHVLFKNRNFCLKQSSYLLSFRKSQIIPVACYHTDSIEAPVFDELVVPEAKLSPEETTKILQKNEASVNFEQNGPMRYYEINYLGANNPTEDRQAQTYIPTCSSYIHLFGVFDGHGGPWCSNVVSHRLFEYIASTLHPPSALEAILKQTNTTISRHHDVIAKDLNQCSSFLHSYLNPLPDMRNLKTKNIHQSSLLKRIEEAYTTFDSDNTDIAGALESAFLTLDRDICAEAIPLDSQKVNEDLLRISTSGSCACVAYVRDTDLYVANCGDSRAILGTVDDNGNASVIALSNDHNIRSQSEIKRVLSEHPVNESHSVIRDDRLLGLLMPFRAFGDVRFKWPKTYVQQYVQPFLKKTDSMPQFYLTPPYLTARPEIKKHKLTKNDKFLVLATDGLWDLISPEKVVEVVFNHLKNKKSLDGLTLNKNENNILSFPVTEINELLHTQKSASENQPIDRNSATHLMRHALSDTPQGQNDSKRLSCLLTFQNPRSVRDDITITIVYFDENYLDKKQANEKRT